VRRLRMGGDEQDWIRRRAAQRRGNSRLGRMEQAENAAAVTPGIGRPDVRKLGDDVGKTGETHDSAEME